MESEMGVFRFQSDKRSNKLCKVKGNKWARVREVVSTALERQT